MTIHTWQLQEAKNKFSEVVNNALSAGPQLITKHGVEAVVLVSYEEYKRLTVAQKSLSAFFHDSPLAEVELDLHRDASEARQEPGL
ncbi:MAG TPA: type II toxin-antitoxin system Phd/YefM family antitoxin [Anaerolineae bacterium]|jgi:prevent-host-death family protein|nr:type II toxin-antitoxin system Phd/YefM family antitoxin [Anaerolineae bacterium]